jgi:cell wall-associated NlpC family hydrolase
MSLGDLIGIPYKVHGSDVDGADCLGLVKLFNKKILNINFPDFTELYRDPNDLVLLDSRVAEQKRRFDAITEPTFGDIILFRIGAYACHLGIYIDESTFLHSHFGHDSAIDRLDSHKWTTRISGFYRVSNI